MINGFYGKIDVKKFIFMYSCNELELNVDLLTANNLFSINCKLNQQRPQLLPQLKIGPTNLVFCRFHCLGYFDP